MHWAEKTVHHFEMNLYVSSASSFNIFVETCKLCNVCCHVEKTRFREYSRCGRTDGSIAKEPFIWITKIKLCIFLVLMLGMPLWLFKTAYGSVHFIFTLTSSKYIQEKHALCASLKIVWLVVARAFKLASIYFAPF